VFTRPRQLCPHRLYHGHNSSTPLGDEKTKPEEKKAKDSEKEPLVPPRAYYEPSSTSHAIPQMFCWKGTWMTVTYAPGYFEHTGKEVGGSLTLKYVVLPIS
jgi:hypothetical protein